MRARTHTCTRYSLGGFHLQLHGCVKPQKHELTFSTCARAHVRASPPRERAPYTCFTVRREITSLLCATVSMRGGGRWRKRKTNTHTHAHVTYARDNQLKNIYQSEINLQWKHDLCTGPDMLPKKSKWTRGEIVRVNHQALYKEHSCVGQTGQDVYIEQKTRSPVSILCVLTQGSFRPKEHSKPQFAGQAGSDSLSVD